MMALGATASPMLQAESAEMGTLQQSPRDGRRIVPAEIPSAAGGSRCSARHPLTSCVDQRKLVPSRHRRCRMTASLRASATFALVAPLRLAKRMPHAYSTSNMYTPLGSAPKSPVRPAPDRRGGPRRAGRAVVLF